MSRAKNQSLRMLSGCNIRNGGMTLKQLPYNPVSKRSEDIDHFEVVCLLKQEEQHASSFMTNFQPPVVQTILT